MTTYFFEISDLVQYIQGSSTLSGIQRVVVNVAKKMAEHHGADNVHLCYFDDDSENSEYRVLSSRLLLDMDLFDPEFLRSVIVPGYEDAVALQKPLRRYRDKPAKLVFHKAKANVHAFLGDKKYFHKKDYSLEDWKQDSPEERRRSREKILEIKKRYFIGNFETVCTPNAKLCILGAMWSNPKAKDYGHLAKKVGAQVSVLIYDLIPLSSPEQTAGELSNIFSSWLKDTTEYVDQYLAISKFAASEMEQYLNELGSPQKVTVVPLVQQFATSEAPDRETSNISNRINEISGIRRSVLREAARPYVLSVGTLETRKNNLGLAQAWEILLRENLPSMPRLVFAGRKGWLNAAFFDWMEASANLGGWVSIIEQPTDQELAYLYKNCEFSAMVSFGEGWGLPIGESLSYGKTAVVADNSSMPEVGEDMVEYCDANRVDSIASSTRTLITDTDHRHELEQRIKSRRLRTWDDVADDFVRALA